MNSGNFEYQTKKKTALELLHLIVLYLLLSLFIFGSLYHRLLLNNLGFGLFYTVTWVSCFLLTPWVLSDNDFNLFRERLNTHLIDRNQYPVWEKIKFAVNYPICFVLLQFILLLLSLQLLPFNLMLIVILGIVAAILFGVIMIIKKVFIAPTENNTDLMFYAIKLVISVYVTWYLLYLGMVILVVNFDPFSQKIWVQTVMILVILLSLYLTNRFASTTATRLKLSFMVGFLIIAAMIAYFSYGLHT